MKILVISPHPDDETLGCGGTLLKFKEQGNDLYWLIVTSIAGDDKRKNEINEVSKKYGFTNFYNLFLPPTSLDTLPLTVLIDKVNKCITKVHPEIILVNSNNDIHSDHHAVFNAVINATKSFRANYVKKILMYETISETDVVPSLSTNFFSPNLFVDITLYIDRKLEIMNIYKSEVMEYPLPRSLDSIKALARYRGSQCNMEYAEAFFIIREVMQ